MIPDKANTDKVVADMEALEDDDLEGVAGGYYTFVNGEKVYDQCLYTFNNTTTWAIDEESFEQVGCIHTSQGLEFDYCGVIIGRDLIYRNGEVVCDFTKRAKTDQSLTRYKDQTFLKASRKSPTKKSCPDLRTAFLCLAVLSFSYLAV